MDAIVTDWRESQLRNYDIPLISVPKYHYEDPRVEELISARKAVIITGTQLVDSARKWDLNYLKENMPNTVCSVLSSKSHSFKYYSQKNVHSSVKSKFKPPTKQVPMKIGEFAERLQNYQKGDNKLYLQQPFNNSVGQKIVEDFVLFRWEWLRDIQQKMKWGPLTSNLLLIGMEGNVTPCHYDEQENLFAQVRGFKRFLLFPTDQFECFYPYPVYHPHDRQSQVNFDSPDYERFPKFSQAQGQEAIVGPGDVLYIPMYWWHHVESLIDGGYTVSVNFWCKAGPTRVEYPLNPEQKVAIMRNLEKTLVEAMKDPEEVGPLLSTLVIGRYTDDVDKSE